MELNDDYIDQEIRKRVAALEGSYPQGLLPPDELWQALLLKKKRRQIRIAWRYGAVAAVVAGLIITISIWQMTGTKKDITPAYRSNDIASSPENDAMAYIKKLCGGNNIACASPAFKELQQELNESYTNLSEINRQIAVFGSDQGLLRAKTRIKNHQAHIIKAMVQIL